LLQGKKTRVNELPQTRDLLFSTKWNSGASNCHPKDQPLQNFQTQLQKHPVKYFETNWCYI